MFIKNEDKLAFVDFEDNKVSFVELIKRVRYFSNEVLKNIDSPHALIIMENRPEWVYSFYSVWDKKEVNVVLDASSNPNEIAYVINDSQPKTIICSDFSEERILEAITIANYQDKARIINIDKENIDFNSIGSEYDNVTLQNPEGDETAVMLYTSGTTGSPKGVMLSSNNIIGEIDGIVEKDVLQANDQMIALLPFHHILPLMATLLLPLREGASIVFVEKIASKEILDVLEKNNISVMVGVPRVFKLFYDSIKQQIQAKFITRKIYAIAEKINSKRFSRMIFSKVHKKFGGHLNVMVSGGAKLDPEIATFFNVLGFTVCEGYGLTETSPVLAVNSIKYNKVGTVGKALYNTELKIVDEELWVKGPQIMKGYYNKPEKTAEVMTEDGWFKTGDLAEIDKDGYLTIRGRKNSMIVLSNGKNIDPETVENKIMGLSGPLIKEIGILGHEDKLAAIIVPDLLEFRKQGINNIQTYLKDIIENYNLTASNYKKVLDYKLVEDELPKTRLGKTKRFMLPELYKKDEKVKEKVEEPQTQEYQAVKEFVAKLKGFEPGPEENLELDLGMDSLDKVELLAYVESTFGIKIDEEKFAEMPNLKLLSEYISEKAEFFMNSEVDWKKIIDKAPNREIKNGWLINALRPLIYVILKMYFRLKIDRTNKISDEPQIFVSNHQSFVDALVLGALIPSKIQKKTFFLAINWYFKKGIMKYVADNGNIILVDIDKNVKETVEEIALHIKNGKNVLIFPEGARTKNGKVGKFKKVFAIIAKELNVDVQCLGIKGGYEAYSRFMKFPLPKRIEVTVLEKIKPEGTYEEIRERAENIIKNYAEQLIEN
ncbi:MAG: AMP-binding protein [Leptotrichiaceae bacterium]|nr:AMP-binding protein [Leptotrichiaceae bacterium]MBP6167664.1 AMP-binding protein [Leptotrichiaceae bacterium]MBP8636952.1 AMP-binding protein [Leptotrichiaceae bacterium]MBP9538894.1 AMP-binding protein [Leptotrichiaceae bacterium]MBP9876099.1 AMP-binding protein [Leptotrichiaceae bacterium]